MLNIVEDAMLASFAPFAIFLLYEYSFPDIPLTVMLLLELACLGP